MRAVQISNRSAKLVSTSRIKIDCYATTENPASPHVNSSILAIKRESFSRVFIVGGPARIGSDLNPRSRSTIWRRNLYRISSEARFSPRTKYPSRIRAIGWWFNVAGFFETRALASRSRSAGIRVWMRGNAFVRRDVSTFLMQPTEACLHTCATCVRDCFSKAGEMDW